MARVEGITKAGGLPADINHVYEQQTQRYGTPLSNHMVLARIPEIFRGFRAMWDGIENSRLLAPPLLSLVSVRVASLVGCGF